MENVFTLKSNYILRKIADSYMIVPIGDQIANFGGVIPTNKTVAAIWDLLKEGATIGQMADQLCEQFDVEKEQAEADLSILMRVLLKRNMVEMA